MDSEHRKIELQSPADLTFLTSQLRAAARQKLDLHLPPVNDSSEPDELRRHVEELVDSFVAQVLAGMRSNISINGIDLVSHARAGEDADQNGMVDKHMSMDTDNAVEKEEYEAFDDRLRAKLSSTVARRDALIGKISLHRRGTPALAAAAFQAQFERENELLGGLQGGIGGSGEGEKEGGLDLGALEREEEVRRNWERAVEGLGRLNKGLPETRARLERCGDVVGFLG
ncbi:hypothetical protein GQ44DRAFT_563408, partial [Phaeosphaeriaceae sp. PMI808]